MFLAIHHDTKLVVECANDLYTLLEILNYDGPDVGVIQEYGHTIEIEGDRFTIQHTERLRLNS